MIQALRLEVSRLTAGDQLPSVRDLMTRLRVSPVTVRDAMAQLASEGVLETRPGAGTFVAQQRLSRAGTADFSWQGLALGPARVAADGLTSLLANPPSNAINLSGGYPAEDLQATSLVRQAMARAARKTHVWGRMPPEGLPALRAWFADRLGAPIAPHEVIITPGSQAAIATTFSALAAPGASVLIESPSYAGAIIAARAASLRLVPVPTDEHGVRPDLLTEAFASSGARLFYCQPTYSNPTGASLSDARRSQVLEIVERAHAFLIEDDWCRDLSFEGSPSHPLIVDDRNGHVVYLRSLTKSAAPSLRIGAIVARGAALHRLAASRAITDFFVPGPIQETALELVGAHSWQRHLRTLRGELASRRDRLIAAVERHLGTEALALVPAGGIHLWVRFPSRVDDLELASSAAQEKVLVSPGRPFFPAEPTGSYCRLSYCGAPEAMFERAVEILARLSEPRHCTRSTARPTARLAIGRPRPSRARPR